MVAIDEDNYKEAIEASFKVFAPPGISKFLILKFWMKVYQNLLQLEICLRGIWSSSYTYTK